MRERRRRGWSSTALASAMFVVASTGGVTAQEIEAAGRSGSVRSVVISAPGAAAVVVWPDPSRLTGNDVSDAAVRVALRIALDDALARHPPARELRGLNDGLIAAGAGTESGADALTKVLRAISTPGAPDDDSIARRLARIRQEAGTRDLGLLAAARDAVVRRLAGLGGRAGPEDLRALTPGEVRRALVRLRDAPVEVRAAGPRGLAAKIAQGLSGRLAAGGATSPEFAVGSSEPLLMEHASRGDRAAIVLGYRIPAPAAEDSVTPLLAELLREGAGSLKQRLAMLGDGRNQSQVRLAPLAGGGGVMLLELTIDASRAADGWAVLHGATTSLRSLPLQVAALVDARRRLDELAEKERTNAGRSALRMLLPESWHWPPPDRWTSPARPQDVQAGAARLFVAERRSVAIAGSNPESLAGTISEPAGIARSPAAPWSAPPRVAALRDALTSGGMAGIPVRFRGEYRVRESTPLGPVTSLLSIEGEPGVVGVHFGAMRRTLSARVAQGRATLRVPEDRAGGAGHPGSADRIVALAYRQPALLVLAALSGEALVTETDADCATGTCPALSAELNDRSRLLVVLDPSTLRPLELRSRWCCGDDLGPPDEVVRYLAWTRKGGVELAADMEVIDLQGIRRSVVLVDWEWADVPAEGNP
ncbi:MAG: hypothetical protein OEQ13_06970 [Acidobacteriota bacterium]|nr:hypothetical protein [Acidobacteriota bacterium]